jgi:exodeoxyribonuclease V beta subunit
VNDFERFDAATLPLTGVRLIEASAGTGKTFSLTGLYLRLLLEQRLDVRDILVMTFTRAATQELRERIRARLALAARLALSSDRPESTDAETAFILQLLVRIDSEMPRRQVARRLRDAASRMDEATITTIHGFAQRAAQENAFDSGLPFDRGEQANEREVFGGVVRDYWRSQVIAQPAAAARAFTRHWPHPESLGAALAPVLQRPHMRLAGPDNAAIAELTRTARQQWMRDRDQFRELLARCWLGGDVKKTGALYPPMAAAGCGEDPHRGVDVLLASIDEGLAGTALGHAGLPDWIAGLGTLDGVEAQFRVRAVKDGCRPDRIAAVASLSALQPLGRLAALRDAHEEVRRIATVRKGEQRKFTFADMIEALHRAITDPLGGEALAAALHRRWPWALVDEFQDTDPLQYGILRRMYVDAARDRGGLVLIGDPKQAIYGFRGGDVYAYLRAAADADGRYSLATNWRSTPALIASVTSLFEMAGPEAFVIDRIRLQAVGAGRSGGDLLHAGRAVAAMTVWPLTEAEQQAAAARDRLLEATVAQISALLEPGAAVLRRDGVVRPLAPGDIAVLVNRNSEAADVQRALARRGIASVCLHQLSVFATDEARELLQVLRAVAAPEDEDAIRAALTSSLLGRPQRGLIRLLEREEEMQVEVEGFQRAHERWRRAGALAMLEPLLQAAAPRLLTLEDGERRMTNLLQLGELLQQAAAQTFGMVGQIDWLSEAIATAARESDPADAAQLRLESDEALVRIATVHKVKGLQFAVVFVPFAAFLGASPHAGRPPFAFHDDADEAWLDVGCGRDAEHRPRAVAEARAEAVRLLYVALTRAEQACYFGWGAANTAANSALAWLLHARDGARPDVQYGDRAPWLEVANVRARLQELTELAPGSIAVEPLPSRSAVCPEPGRGVRRSGAPVRRLPAPRLPWSVYSFTRLVRDAAAPEARSGADDGALSVEPVDGSGSGAGAFDGPLDHVRGAPFGNAMHELLETIPLDAWPTPDAADRVRTALRNHGIGLGEETGARIVDASVALVTRVLTTPLPGVGALAQLPATARRAEIAFFMRLGAVPVQKLLDRIASAGYPLVLAQDEARRVLRGLLEGFIDLVVEADRRFYVIDYKTNWLGGSFEAYRPEALASAMRRGHYELQFLIYCVALHRHLRRRLKHYDPDSHLGGVRYLFLRGMNGRDAATGVFAHRPDPDLIDALDQLLDAGGATS